MTFDEITASSLVKIDLDGRKLSTARSRSTRRLHDPQRHPRRARRREVRTPHAQHQRRRGSATKAGVLPLSQQSTFVLGSLGYHDYEGVALNAEEKPRLVRDLGDKTFFMLRNHGLLTVGPTIADAFLAMYLFESACTIQLRAQAASPELISIEPKVLEGAMMMARMATRGRHGRAPVARAAAQARPDRSELPHVAIATPALLGCADG